MIFSGAAAWLGRSMKRRSTRRETGTMGQPLREALWTAGLEGLPRRMLEEGRYKGAFEVHIEHGTQLERADLCIEIVTGILGVWQWRIVVEGQQDHTGGTTIA